jgi:hypothetical protein
MFISPPIRFRIEWADSQGKVTASWLAAHFNFPTKLSNATEIRFAELLRLVLKISVLAISPYQPSRMCFH